MRNMYQLVAIDDSMNIADIAKHAQLWVQHKEALMLAHKHGGGIDR